MNALCTASSRPVRDPTTRGESCGFVDESFGPARALWAVWTANAHALSTALPTLSRLSPTSSTGPTTDDSQNKHRTTLRRGCLHRPFKTTSASHSNRSQHRPRAGSPPTLQAHFRMGLDCPLLLTALGPSPPALLLHHRHERIDRRCTRSLVAGDERIDLDLMNRDRGAAECSEPGEQLSHRVPIAWHPGAENPFFHPESSHLVKARKPPKFRILLP